MKRATNFFYAVILFAIISIHALVKRATVTLPLSTHTSYISIHALVKRATAVGIRQQFVFFISIHALVKRATRFYSVLSAVVRYFNPRPREEGDHLPNLNRPYLAISIHALVKRATPYLHA